MIYFDALADLVEQHQRFAGAPRLAEKVGATHLCVFVRDPEFGRFIPGLGFPQRLPDGLAWKTFLANVAEGRQTTALLTSPFTDAPTHVSGRLLDPDTLSVLFGNHLVPDAHTLIAPALRLCGALCLQEIRTRLSEVSASIARRSVGESRKAIASLSGVHEQLAAALHRSQQLTGELRREQERLDLACRVFSLGAWEMDATTRVFVFSPQAAAIFGVLPRPSQYSLDSLLRAVHPEDHEAVQSAISAMLLTYHEQNVRFRIVCPNDTVRWVEHRGMLVQPAGDDHQTVIGFSHDITQRVVSERALIRSEKLAAAGRLAASIAHEINNPLEGLMNLVYLARRNNSLEEVQQLLTMADVEVSRIAGVARQTLGFYRDQQRPARFGLGEAIEQTLQLMRHEYPARFRFEIHPRASQFPPAEICGWPGEIRQAISNLLLNALQASEPGAYIHIRLCPGLLLHRLLIADCGHGIAPENRERIFDPFFSTRRETGTGLGLWITRQIVEKHGGTIRLRSNTSSARHGTLFRLTLPAAIRASSVNGRQSLGYRWLTLNPS